MWYRRLTRGRGGIVLPVYSTRWFHTPHPPPRASTRPSQSPTRTRTPHRVLCPTQQSCATRTATRAASTTPPLSPPSPLSHTPTPSPTRAPSHPSPDRTLLHTCTTSRRAPTALEQDILNVQRTRNISIVAHIDAGKTTTTERMLYYAGVLARVGEVDKGTTTTDFMTEEMERGITIQSAAVSLSWRGHTIHLIDTPGHMDFTVEVERAMRVVDGVVAVFDASAGVQAQSYTVLQQSRKFGIPVIAFLNKMDKFNANAEAAVASMAAKLRVQPVWMQLPLHAEDGSFDGVIDLVHMQTLRFAGPHGATLEMRPLPCDGGGRGLTSRGRQPAAPPHTCANRTNDCTGAVCTVRQNTEQEEAYADGDAHVVRKARAGRHALVSALVTLDDALMEEFLTLLEESESHRCGAAATPASEPPSHTPPPSSVLPRHETHTTSGVAGESVDHEQEEEDEEEEEERAAAARMPASSIHAAVRRILLHQQHACIRQQQQLLSSSPSHPYMEEAKEEAIRPLVPVFCGASRRNQGVQPLLDAITRYLPAPGDRVLMGRNRAGQRVPMPALSLESNSDVFALAFKVIHARRDAPSLGGGGGHGKGGADVRQPLVFLRVYTGRITPRMRLRNRSRGDGVVEVVEAVYVMQAEQRVEVPVLLAGQIGAVFLKHTYTGDTLVSTGGAAATRSSRRADATGAGGVESDFFSAQTMSYLTARFSNSSNSRVSSTTKTQQQPSPSSLASSSSDSSGHRTDSAAVGVDGITDTDVYTLEGIDFPPPVLSFSIEAATRKDVPLLETGLAELAREDPSLRVGRDNFGHVVMSGMGELHLEIALSRLRRDYQAQCRLLRAVIEYREIITDTFVVAGLVGTHMDLPHVECSLALEPMPGGALADGEDGAVATCAQVCFAVDEALRARILTSSAAVSAGSSLSVCARELPSGGGRAAMDESTEDTTCDAQEGTNTTPHGLRHPTEDLRCLEACFASALSVVSRLGPLAGLPLHGVRVVLTDFRKVGASDVQEKVMLEVARSLLVRAFRAVPRTRWAVIEPMVSVQVHLSDSAFVGGVVNSLNQHRATTVEVQEEGRAVYAIVALRNIVHYTTELRRIVKGHANFFTKLHHYRRVEDQSVKSRILSNLGVTQPNS